LWTALVAGVVATAMGIALQAPYAEGAGLSRMFEPSGWRAVVDTRSGRAWEARLLLLLLVGTGLLATIRRVRTTAWRLVAGAAGVALIVAYAESGHGGVGRAPLVGLVVTVAHLAAMSVWVGGLVLLALVVLPTPSPAEAIGVTRRFSAWAFAAVVVVVASGLVQAWRQVGSLHAATSTTYGRTLLVKTALVVALVGVGALSRLALQRRLFDWRPAAVAQPVGAAVAVDHDRTGVDDDASVLRRLRRTVGAEVVLAGAVLAVTSLLVAAAPAVSAATGPFNTSVVQGSRIADISIIPAGVGRNTTHIYIITPSGSLDPASSIDVSITNLDRNIGPLPVPVEKAGPNHVTTDNMQIPFPGTWRIDVAAVFGQFDQVDFLATFHV
jgi:copper transport protein